jgi:hypothetical protein
MTETALIARLDDRRKPGTPAREVRLWPDMIETVSDGRLETRIALDHVRHVRISVEPAGREAQVVCRVRGRGVTLSFGSLSRQGVSKWINNAANYRTFLIAVLDAVKDRTDVRFLDGPSLWSRLKISGIAALVALSGLGFMVWMWAARGNPVMALAGLAVLAAGAYGAWVFRPRKARRFDPEEMIASLRAQAARSATPDSVTPGSA